MELKRIDCEFYVNNRLDLVNFLMGKHTKKSMMLGLVYLSYPPLLAAIFVSDKAESTRCSLPTIDLIPDFIPVIGYLDDLIILPLGIYLAIKLIPEAVWSDCLAKAELHPIQLPRNRYAAAVIIGCWILFAGMCSYGIWYLISN